MSHASLAIVKNSSKTSRLSYLLRHPKIYGRLRAILRQHLTYLSREALIELCNSVAEIERNQIPGLMLEAGCALGGSAIAIALTKRQHRQFDLYDVFAQIPAPTDQDGADVHERYKIIISGQAHGIDDNPYYGYLPNLDQVVTRNFHQFGFDLAKDAIHLIKGPFQDTMHITHPVAFAHLDCDWYESVQCCLRQIVPNLSIGGHIVVDDYVSWSGCRRAVDEYFADQSAHFRFELRASLHIVRLSFQNA